MSIFGYMTLDSESNLNSKIGGVLLSIFIPLTIVWRTPKMTGLERFLKFGIGLIAYAIMAIFTIGFIHGLVSGLFICFIIALGILFYGNELSNNSLKSEKMK